LRSGVSDAVFSVRAHHPGLGTASEDDDLVFKEVFPGEYFPAILRNGRFFAQPVGGTQTQEILTVTDAGLECGGVSFMWSDIKGLSIQGETAHLLSDKYPSGGLRFYVGTCYFVGSNLLRDKHQQGYPVEYCLMNRITFEQQRLSMPVS